MKVWVLSICLLATAVASFEAPGNEIPIEFNEDVVEVENLFFPTGRPICYNIFNWNQKFRHIWYPNRYWKCDRFEAVLHICDVPRLFQQSLQKCVFPWHWEYERLEPPSFPKPTLPPRPTLPTRPTPSIPTRPSPTLPTRPTPSIPTRPTPSVPTLPTRPTPPTIPEWSWPTRTTEEPTTEETTIETTTEEETSSNPTTRPTWPTWPTWPTLPTWPTWPTWPSKPTRSTTTPAPTREPPSRPTLPSWPPAWWPTRPTPPPTSSRCDAPTCYGLYTYLLQPSHSPYHFYQCAPFGPVLMPCARGTRFSFTKQHCVHPEDWVDYC